MFKILTIRENARRDSGSPPTLSFLLPSLALFYAHIFSLGSKVHIVCSLLYVVLDEASSNQIFHAMEVPNLDTHSLPSSHFPSAEAIWYPWQSTGNEAKTVSEVTLENEEVCMTLQHLGENLAVLTGMVVATFAWYKWLLFLFWSTNESHLHGHLGMSCSCLAWRS